MVVRMIGGFHPEEDIKAFSGIFPGGSFGNRALRRYGVRLILLFIVTSSFMFPAHGANLVRGDVGPGTSAVLRGGRVIFLECALPGGDAAKGFLERYLTDPALWTSYRNRAAVAIPFAQLNPKTQRSALEALFPEDYVDKAGWWHVAPAGGEASTDVLWALTEWLTGVGTNYKKVLADARNRGVSMPLPPGRRILIPSALLKEVMQTPTPARLVPADMTAPAAANGELEYSSDAEGAYAVYRLKKGEALYSAVVVRFTDFGENEEIRRACDVVQRRSGIRDVRRMCAGQRVLIPLEMLSDRYQPVGSEERAAYEAVQQEAQRLQADRVRTKDLDGVVVILDAGHGGRDHGAPIEKLALYEDEINYDIMCRIKTILERETRAKVYATSVDQSEQYVPVDKKRFVHDRDEELLTTPPYENDDATISANLRWYLANSMYRKERDAGVDERKIVFTSIHCDALFNETLRGAMIYVPGAKYRSDIEKPSNPIYNRFQEAREQRASATDAASRRRDEALSRNFAEEVLAALRANHPPIKVHSAGDPIRNVIRQKGGKAYVPAVLRNALAPTKILVECANLTNPEDQKNVADPAWRQWFAEAFVAALRKHFA